MSNTLVLYYSQSACNLVRNGDTEEYKGNTQIAAEIIQDTLGCDIFRVELLEEHGNDWYADRKRLKKIMKSRPELKSYLTDVSSYDNIFVCTPCWWGSLSPAIMSQLDMLNLAGKKIMGLVTHEDSDPEGSINDLRKLYKKATFGKSILVLGEDIFRQSSFIQRWAMREVK